MVTFETLGIITATAQFVLALVVTFLNPADSRRFRRHNTAKWLLVASLLISMAGNIANVLFSAPDLAFSVFFFWSCSTQNILMGFVSILFANPAVADRRFVTINISVYAFFNLLLISSALFFPEAFPAVFIICFTAGILFSAYIFSTAVRAYNAVVRNMEEYYSEDYDYLIRYRKAFNFAIGAGLALLIAVPFTGHYPAPSVSPFNIIWRTLFILYYIYVSVLFLRQSFNKALIARMYEGAGNPTDAGNQVPEWVSGQISGPSAGEARKAAFDRLEIALRKWIYNKSYMESDIPTAQIAESLETDIFTFRDYFREKKGEDFRTWRQRLRIEEACRIMSGHPEMSYELVAETVGINDRSNFKKTFTKIMGMSPKEWRKTQK